MRPGQLHSTLHWRSMQESVPAAAWMHRLPFPSPGGGVCVGSDVLHIAHALAVDPVVGPDAAGAACGVSIQPLNVDLRAVVVAMVGSCQVAACFIGLGWPCATVALFSKNGA